MIRGFKSKGLEELWLNGRSARIDSRLGDRIRRRLDRLNEVERVQQMNLPGFDFRSLRGFDPTRYSVHVNGPWCITFTFDDGDAGEVDLEQYH
ncbi:MAG: type II toxin-antitoxin system RelE/ParE family toxin [Devosia sp.]